MSKALEEMISEHGNIPSGIHELAGQLVQAQQKRDQDIVVVAQEKVSRTSSVRNEMDVRFSAAQAQ